MVIVYTFDSTVNEDKEKNTVIKNYYLESINRAKKLGYTVEMYTNCDWFTNVVDKVYIRERRSLLWDSYKFIPLLERKDNFILLDGDVFLDDKINLSTIHDVLFDTYETGNWNLLYARSVNRLPGNLANGAVYILSPELINTLATNFYNVSDFSTEVLQHLVGRIYTYETQEYFIDIGSPEAYCKVNLR